MKKVDVGQGITILANLGVLAGLLLLAFELNQNREMMRAQIRHELSSNIADQLLAIAGNSEFNDFVHRADSGEPVSGADQRRCLGYAFARLRYWEDAHYRYRVGLYDEIEFAAQKESWKEIIRRPGMRQFWDQHRASFLPNSRRK